MIMKLRLLFAYSFFIVWNAFAESPLVTTDGVGTRALGLGNNYTALSSDYSAVFWNPAGLAFLPIREASVGLSGSNLAGDTKFGGTETTYDKSQMQLSNIGLVRSLPTTRGGFAFALGYSRPYNLNDLRVFTGSNVYNFTAITKDGDTIYYWDTLHLDIFKKYISGSLGMWSAAAGWQVADGLGFGITASVINGVEQYYIRVLSHSKKGIYDNSDMSTKTTYTGLDLRLGGLYQVNSNLSIGVRVEIPRTIHYREESIDATISGTIKSSLSGALGIATTLSFATITADVNFRSPNPDVDFGDLAYWKTGAGAGIEIPLRKLNTILRGGYNRQELDIYPYADYIDNQVQIDKTIITSGTKDLQTFTCGITFILSNSITIDGAYAYSNFSILTSDLKWRNALAEEYTNQRGAVTVSVRY